MDSSTRATFAVGAVAGYVVGRTKKEKLALGLLSLVTGRALDPTARIGQGVRKLAENRQLEELGEAVVTAVQQRARALLDSEADGESEEPASGADGGEAEEPGELDQAEAEALPSPETPRTEEAEAEMPGASAHAAGPKNPPAAKAKAMGRKAKAARSARRPGPKNPPAAKARARKAAHEKAAAGQAAGKPPNSGDRRR